MLAFVAISLMLISSAVGEEDVIKEQSNVKRNAVYLPFPSSLLRKALPSLLLSKPNFYYSVNDNAGAYGPPQFPLVSPFSYPSILPNNLNSKSME